MREICALLLLKVTIEDIDKAFWAQSEFKAMTTEISLDKFLNDNTASWAKTNALYDAWGNSHGVNYGQFMVLYAMMRISYALCLISPSSQSYHIVPNFDDTDDGAYPKHLTASDVEQITQDDHDLSPVDYGNRDLIELHQSDICTNFGLSKQNVNKVVKDYIEQGIFIALPSKTDKRSKVIFFTKKGLLYARTLLDPLFAVERELYASLNPKHLQICLKVQQQFNLLLGQYLEDRKRNMHKGPKSNRGRKHIVKA